MLELPLEDKAEVLFKWSERAAQEHSLEQSLDRMESELQELQFELVPAPALLILSQPP